MDFWPNDTLDHAVSQVSRVPAGTTDAKNGAGHTHAYGELRTNRRHGKPRPSVVGLPMATGRPKTFSTVSCYGTRARPGQRLPALRD